MALTIIFYITHYPNRQEYLLMAELNKSMKIIIADDSANMLRTLANMLRVMGFEYVTRAVDGENAIQKIRNIKPDLILCDWNMPKMKGVQVLQAVRDDEELRLTPFLMITGEVDNRIVAEAAESEVDGYLLKPFTLEDLEAKLDEILTRKKEPSPIDIHLNVSKVYMEARQWEMAKEELRKAMQINSKSPRVAFALGKLHEAQGDLQQARQMYQRAVTFGQQFIKGYEALAKVNQALGDMDAATDSLKKAVYLSPRNLDRQLDLSHILVRRGQKDEVQKVLKNVLGLAEQNRSEVAQKVGEVYLEAGMAAQAQEVFTQALESDPKALQIYNRLGIALRRQKKYLEAIDNYKRALKIDPENENLYYNLGRAFWDAGKKDMAAAAMKRALRIYPEFTEAKDFLTKIGAN
jgi:tetratricopeptide (TPR) repeat protein